MAAQPLISHFSPGTTGGLELILWMCWPPQHFDPLPRMTFGEIIVESSKKNKIPESRTFKSNKVHGKYSKVGN